MTTQTLLTDPSEQTVSKPEEYPSEAGWPRGGMEVDFAHCLDQDTPLESLINEIENSKQMVEPDSGKDAWTVQLLSDKEADRLVTECERIGFRKTNYSKEYRSNSRLILRDDKLALILFDRLKTVLKPMLKVTQKDRFQSGEVSGEWRMQLEGLNETFRFCKYDDGQHFSRHYDSVFQRSEDEVSYYTVNIYLNSGDGKDFNDGRTVFFDWSKDGHGGGTNTESSSVTAQAGLALVFKQRPELYLHSGEVVNGGVKYIMRTDVMYRKTLFKQSELSSGCTNCCGNTTSSCQIL